MVCAMDCADFIRVSNFLRRQSNIESAKRALKEIFRCRKIIIKVAKLGGVSMSLVGQDRSFSESRIRKWKQDVASNPQDYEALASIGAAYGKLGDNTTALTYFEDAIAVNPSYAEAFVGLGSACAFLRKADEAVAARGKPYLSTLRVHSLTQNSVQPSEGPECTRTQSLN